MNHRCPACNGIMFPISLKHECTNRACRAALDVRVAPGSMPRTADGLIMTLIDVKHNLVALKTLDHRASAKKAGIHHHVHARCIASVIRKLEAYQQVLEEIAPQGEEEERSEWEQKRMDIVERMKAGELTAAEAQQMIADLANQEEEDS